jgi:arylformamidase
LERVNKIEEGANSNVSRLVMSVHAGTHVDAPVHFLPGEKGVDGLSLDTLIGPAQLIELPDEVDTITEFSLKTIELLPETRRVLFKTRNSKLWAKKNHLFNKDFVAISADGAEFLVKNGIHLVGVDYLSVSPYKNSRPTHNIFLKAGVVLLEGLNLSEVPSGSYELICLPLKLGGSDGAPARAVLISNE